MIHPDLAIFVVRGRLNNPVHDIKFRTPIYRFHRECVKRGEFRIARAILQIMQNQQGSQDVMIADRLMPLAKQCGVMVTNEGFGVIAWGHTAAKYENCVTSC